MKKYTAPNMTVSRFMTENIITTSGVKTAEQSVQEKMQSNGKNYTAVKSFEITL